MYEVKVAWHGGGPRQERRTLTRALRSRHNIPKYAPSSATPSQTNTRPLTISINGQETEQDKNMEALHILTDDGHMLA